MIPKVNGNRLVYGTYRLPSQYSSFFALIRECIHKEIPWIDTAHCYQHGTSEKWIGNVLDSLHNRKMRISTKIGKGYNFENKLEVSLRKDSTRS